MATVQCGGRRGDDTASLIVSLPGPRDQRRIRLQTPATLATLMTGLAMVTTTTDDHLRFPLNIYCRGHT